MSTWWNWSGSAWHWTIYILVAAVLVAGTGYVRFLREQRDRLDGVEWDDGWQREPETEADAVQLIADLTTDLPGPATLESDPRAGELHLEPWLERAWWDDPDLVVWDARRQADRCWEILHVEFPRLRAELCGVA